MMLHILIVKKQLRELFQKKVLKDNTDEVDRNCKYDGHQRTLTYMFHKFFIKKIGSDLSVNEKLTEEKSKNSKEEKSM